MDHGLSAATLIILFGPMPIVMILALITLFSGKSGD